MAERLAIIDYGAGNLRSAAKAVERAAQDAGRELLVDVTADAAQVARADRILLPGVGAFGQCAAALRALPDMEATLRRAVFEQAKPFLGICVGMQLLADSGEEHGTHQGLGWISGRVLRLAPEDSSLKIPHMGWSPVHRTAQGRAHKAVAPVEEDGQAYFVHSYYFAPQNSAELLATCDYGGAYAAIVGRDTILGTQFHPEKSQSYGLAFLRYFLEWKP